MVSLRSFFAATLAIAGLASAFTIPERPATHIERRNTNVTIPQLDGTGCPKESSNITISANNLIRPTNISIEITTDTFSAFLGPDSLAIERQRNCIFLVHVAHLPPSKEGDYQYAVTGIQIEGSVSLSDSFITASWTGAHYFATQTGMPQQKPFSAIFTGPVEKTFNQVTKTLGTPSYSTCGKTEPLAIINTIAINSIVSEFQSGFIGSPAGFLRISLSLEWKKCTK